MALFSPHFFFKEKKRILFFFLPETKCETKKTISYLFTWSKWEPSSLMQVSRGLLHNGAAPQASPNPVK